MTLVKRTDARMPARAYCGMWIVDCGLCTNAEHIDPSSEAVDCTYCGARLEIIWPTLEMIRGVERLLSMRPLPYTRNWWPGETLNDLVWENGEHGVLTRHLEPLGDQPGSLLLSVSETEIRTDSLPVMARPELKMVER